MAIKDKSDFVKVNLVVLFLAIILIQGQHLQQNQSDINQIILNILHGGAISVNLLLRDFYLYLLCLWVHIIIAIIGKLGEGSIIVWRVVGP